MRACLDAAWDRCKTDSAHGGLSKYVAQIVFQNACIEKLGAKVLVEWQGNGDCLVAGVIYFALEGCSETENREVLAGLQEALDSYHAR